MLISSLRCEVMNVKKKCIYKSNIINVTFRVEVAVDPQIMKSPGI